MKYPVMISFLLAAATFALPAQAQPAVDPSPEAVQAGRYRVETSHTRVLFAVSHLGFNNWYGEFPGATGTLSLDPAKIEAAKLSVSLPVATLTTTNAKLDAELRSADWFNAAQYPTINFKSTKVERTGPASAAITGDLTMHGVTKPVMLNASFVAGGVNPMNKAYTIGFHATGRLKRSDFGVTTYLPLIGDEVEIIVSAAFERQE